MPNDLIGKVFGRLTVIQQGDKIVWDVTHTETSWLCRCECGIEKTIARSKLGRTKSCGCSRKGNSFASKWKNEGYKSPEYQSWRNMLTRCYYDGDKDYAQYGGRGIQVCDEWRTDFDAYYDHVGPRPAPGYTVDRVDPDEDYKPGNVRWVTRKEQARNRRKNHHLVVNGVSKTLAEWAEVSGVNYETALWRFKRGRSPEEILKSTRSIP